MATYRESLDPHLQALKAAEATKPAALAAIRLAGGAVVDTTVTPHKLYTGGPSGVVAADVPGLDDALPEAPDPNPPAAA